VRDRMEGFRFHFPMLFLLFDIFIIGIVVVVVHFVGNSACRRTCALVAI